MNAPLSPIVRFASASLGAFIAALGIWSALSHEGPLGGSLFIVGWGVLMIVPVFARPARTAEAARANLKRFRYAFLATLAAALLCYALVGLAKRGALSESVVPDMQALAGAAWLVAFVLLFFAAYYATQVKQLDERRDGTAGDGRA